MKKERSKSFFVLPRKKAIASQFYSENESNFGTDWIIQSLERLATLK